MSPGCQSKPSHGAYARRRRGEMEEESDEEEGDEEEGDEEEGDESDESAEGSRGTDRARAWVDGEPGQGDEE
ncbi:unnamed protein product [Diplocarpon coronariae]